MPVLTSMSHNGNMNGNLNLNLNGNGNGNDSHPLRSDSLGLNLGTSYLHARSASPNTLNPPPLIFPNTLNQIGSRSLNGLNSHEDVSYRDEDLSMRNNSKPLASYNQSAYSDLDSIQSRLRALSGGSGGGSGSGNSLGMSSSSLNSNLNPNSNSNLNSNLNLNLNNPMGSQNMQHDRHDFLNLNLNPSGGMNPIRAAHPQSFNQPHPAQHFMSQGQGQGGGQGQGQGVGHGSGPPAMRLISAGSSSMGWDESSRGRNINSLPPPPGQSQQVFQSQQQLQEQESSRVHHQSRQFQFALNESSEDVSDFIDDFLELSVKAKPFVPQYTKSPGSSMPMPPHIMQPLLKSPIMGGLPNPQSQSFLGTGSAIGSTVGAHSSSNGSIDPWGSLPTQTHTSHQNVRGQAFDKQIGGGGGGGFNMPMPMPLSSLSLSQLPVMSPLSSTTPPLSLPLPMGSISNQSSPFSAVLRSFSEDRSLNIDNKPCGGSGSLPGSVLSSYPSNLGGSLMQELESMDHYGTHIVDDLEKDDSYPETIPSILSSLLMNKNSNLNLNSAVDLNGSSRALGSDEFAYSDHGSNAFLMARNHTAALDQGHGQGPPNIFGAGYGAGTGPFGRPRPFLPSHAVPSSLDGHPARRETAHSFQADR